MSFEIQICIWICRSINFNESIFFIQSSLSLTYMHYLFSQPASLSVLTQSPGSNYGSKLFNARYCDRWMLSVRYIFFFLSFLSFTDKFYILLYTPNLLFKIRKKKKKKNFFSKKYNRSLFLVYYTILNKIDFISKKLYRFKIIWNSFIQIEINGFRFWNIIF